MNDDHYWHEVTTRFPQFRVISASNFKEYRFYGYAPSTGKSGIWSLADAACVAFLSFVCYTVSAVNDHPLSIRVSLNIYVRVIIDGRYQRLSVYCYFMGIGDVPR